MNMNSHFRLSAIVLLSCSALLVGCGADETPSATSTEAASEEQTLAPPTPEEAAEIIQKAPEYSDFRFTSVTLSLPMQEAQMHEQMKAYARDLERAQWLRIDSTGTVVLSDKARKDRKWVERTNGFTDIAPLARKEFVEVRSVEQAGPDRVKVDFTYRWEPNAAGAALQSGLLHETINSPQYATATLEAHGGEWQMYIIRSDETPPADDAPPGPGAEQDESDQ